MILLEQNYRSTQLILDAATAVIKHNPHRVHKDLFTDREGGTEIVIREAYNEQDEAATIVSTIENLMLQGYDGNSFAVMYRTNAQSRALEEAFVQAQLPYRLVGATQFYQRREVKDILAYLRVVNNPLDMISFNRVLNTPTRGIGQTTQQQLNDWAGTRQPAGRSLDEPGAQCQPAPSVQGPPTGRTDSRFGGMLDAWVQLREASQRRRAAGRDPGTDRLPRIHRRRHRRGRGTLAERDGTACRGRIGSSTVTLSEFLEQVSLVSETDNLEETTKAPTLLTLHAAKGLEFPSSLSPAWRTASCPTAGRWMTARSWPRSAVCSMSA